MAGGGSVAETPGDARGVPGTPVTAGTILVVDDEGRILNFVARGLRSEGYAVDVAADGEEGLRRAIEGSFDVVVLDLLMPAVEGMAVLRRLLEHKPDQVVIVLSCLTDPESKVRCLELGAEDYLGKPFSFDELLARIRARLRSATRAERARLAAGGLTLDLVRQEADAGTGPVVLSKREFLLLRELMRNAGGTVSKERLLSTVWGYHFDPGSNVVDVCVRRIRSKLGPDAIQTVRGEGYRVAAG